jgi:hypothetical protein
MLGISVLIWASPPKKSFSVPMRMGVWQVELSEMATLPKTEGEWCLQTWIQSSVSRWFFSMPVSRLGGQMSYGGRSIYRRFLFSMGQRR